MVTRIGTSGWSYAQWKPRFYPQTMPASQWLSYYAQQCNSVELNASFYALPKPETIRTWYERTPDNFVFSVKAWNLITHKKQLTDCAAELDLFLERISLFKEKGGPILFQLPYGFKQDFKRLNTFLTLLPQNHRYAFELRHPSWWQDETYAMLRAHEVAFCIFELASLRSPRVVTTDFLYLRLHGREAAYTGRYTQEELREWKAWCVLQQVDAYAYFNNTLRADDAVMNAVEFSDLPHKAL